MNDRNDIELIPRVGIQKIILGTADSLDIKMRNLLAFYKQAMPKVGWDTYKTINIKYTNQVVCEKNKIDSVALRAQLKKDAADSIAQKSLPIDSLIRDDIKKQVAADKEEDKTNTRKNK